jgi:predicted MFS family arabinose efflux permease
VSYEWKAVLLLALGFGLVGLDRWVITPLFPTIVQDLHLTYQDVGNAVGALAIVWGVSAIWMGRLADRIGHRKVIIPALVMFSLMSAFTGLAAGALSLVMSRALMGAAEGAYTPACTAATAAASEPGRRGRGQGFVFCAFPLLGLGLGPIIATQLMGVVPSWRWVFYVVAVPGLIVAALLYRTLRDPPRQARAVQVAVWPTLLRSRNVVLATVGMVCGMSCVFVLGAMLPSYLVDYLHLSPTDMGLLMSALGFGGGLGNFLLPAISDYVGRKGTVMGGAAVAALGVVLLSRLGGAILPLYVTLFIVAVCSFGVVSTASGPVATEAVPASMASSAIGIVSGVAEIFGGGVAPIIGGFVATHFGIQYVLYIGLVGLCAAIPIGALLIETAPRRARLS